MHNLIHSLPHGLHRLILPVVVYAPAAVGFALPALAALTRMQAAALQLRGKRLRLLFLMCVGHSNSFYCS